MIGILAYVYVRGEDIIRIRHLHEFLRNRADFGLYVYMICVYMHTYRHGNLGVYMHTYRRIAIKTYRICGHFLCLCAYMPKEITFYVISGKKRDPSEICANPNLRNQTHITKKPSYVHTFFTSTSLTPMLHR